MAQPEGNLSPTLAAMLAIESLRDAVNFVNTRPATDLDFELLIDGLIAVYKAAGIELSEAQLLYRESMERYSHRLLQIEKERLYG